MEVDMDFEQWTTGPLLKIQYSIVEKKVFCILRVKRAWCEGASEMSQRVSAMIKVGVYFACSKPA